MKAYIGIDMNRDWAMVSIYSNGMDDATTISTVAGEEKYHIPWCMFLSKKGTIFYGSEAIKRKNSSDGVFYDDVYEKARNEGPENEFYKELLAEYIRRFIRFTDRVGMSGYDTDVTLSVKEIDAKNIELYRYIQKKLGYDSSNFRLMDVAESFFYFAYHQDKSIWLHDVCVFEFVGRKIEFIILHRNPGRVATVSSRKMEWDVPEEIMADSEQKDEFFSSIIKEAFLKKAVSGIFLIGEGFEGNWMKNTYKVIGQNKRVFIGKNLYTKGDCFAGNVITRELMQDVYYYCDYKLQGEIGAVVRYKGELVTTKLLSAGINYFEPTECYYIIYDGNPELELCIRTIGSLGLKSALVKLDDLPERPMKTIRLKLQVIPIDGEHVELKVEDDGFGELFEKSDRSWSFKLDLL